MVMWQRNVGVRIRFSLSYPYPIGVPSVGGRRMKLCVSAGSPSIQSVFVFIRVVACLTFSIYASHFFVMVVFSFGGFLVLARWIFVCLPQNFYYNKLFPALVGKGRGPRRGFSSLQCVQSPVDRCSDLFKILLILLLIIINRSVDFFKIQISRLHNNFRFCINWQGETSIVAYLCQPENWE
jgi:hypothetical protein